MGCVAPTRAPSGKAVCINKPIFNARGGPSIGVRADFDSVRVFPAGSEMREDRGQTDHKSATLCFLNFELIALGKGSVLSSQAHRRVWWWQWGGGY